MDCRQTLLYFSWHQCLIRSSRSRISGCIACLGCVKDNICKVQDDLFDLRAKIVAADAYVIGAPNFYSAMNATTHAFLERWYQFRTTIWISAKKTEGSRLQF